MLGANVTEMIAEIVVARKLETTGHEIIKSVHPHPTMSEAIMKNPTLTVKLPTYNIFISRDYC